MRGILTAFLRDVRDAGVPISLSESIDAMRAAAAAGVERETLREALAAAAVKDEADRETFDEAFERFFSVEEARRRRRSGPRPAGEGGEGRAGRGHAGTGRAAAPAEPRRERPRSERRSDAPRDRERAEPENAGPVLRRRRRRGLVRKPFREMDAAEAEELAELAAELARRFRGRLARRFRRGRRGRLDFRRTIRGSITHGGAPFHLELRRRRPDPPDLVVLCDVSGSVRHAAELFAALLVPCRLFFRRVRLGVYVDRLVEAGIENGRLVPHEPVDLYGFSDLGRVLLEVEERWSGALTRNTLLLVLGDARNNRRPARADVLGRLRARVRGCWWLVPEARSRWGTGDSAIEAYRPHCSERLECANAAGLLAALDRLAR